MLLEGLIRQWGIPLALYSDRHAAFKYNARQKPVPVETTQFARVMRHLRMVHEIQRRSVKMRHLMGIQHILEASVST